MWPRATGGFDRIPIFNRQVEKQNVSRQAASKRIVAGLDVNSYVSLKIVRFPMKNILTAALLLAGSAAFAGEITVDDSYARVARPGAPTGAIFMVIQNAGETADTLIGAASPVAKRVELHTHIEKDGVMMMRPIEGGIEIAADGSHTLQRGGDHVMLMGLTEKLEDGMTVELTLSFENAGDVVISVPVDSARGQANN